MSTLSQLSWGAAQFITKLGTRTKWYRRGVAPEKAKTLAQKMAEWNKSKDLELHYRVNIGFINPQIRRKDVLDDRLKIRNQIKENLEMEKAAKNRTLTVPVEGVHDESIKTNRSLHLHQAAEYFNIYEDLFEDAYFSPVVPLQISYTLRNKGQEKEGIESRVFSGNQITPLEANDVPKVSYPAKSGSMYTLALTTPDCHLSGGPKEYLHWLVGNIPGNSIDKGQLLCDYMRPFPFRGLGYCRYIFVLYKQDKKLDFTQYQRSQPSCKNLEERTFSTYDFYREFQDNMTPAGLAFFQANWDQSCTSFFHNVLDMKEPVFEYDFIPLTLKPQKWFPVRQPFNLYMDKYKDPKQLQKELLLEKLKERHPFKPPPTPPKYPLAHRIPKPSPSWLNDDIKRRRVREGKWKFM